MDGLHRTTPSADPGVSAQGIDNLTLTDGHIPGSAPIYPHGFCARAIIEQDKPTAEEHLRRCGWEPGGNPRWKVYAPQNGNRRSVMRGSAWLSHKKPTNKKLPMSRANKTWKTNLYTVGIDEGATHYAVDLEGVRYRDISRFMEQVLDLTPNEYRIEYYRRAERYIVLTPSDAERMAQRLGIQPQKGRGRLSRKQYVINSYEVPVTIRQRSAATVYIKVYRIQRGATWVYRCEACLLGKRRDRNHFHEADIQRLDEALLKLIDDYQLQPIPKPARWEPRNFSAPIEHGRFDANTQKLGQKAYRGYVIEPPLLDAIEKCHPPKALFSTKSFGSTGTYLRSARIRTVNHLHSQLQATERVQREAPDSSAGQWSQTYDGPFVPTLYVNDAYPGRTAQTKQSSGPDQPWRELATEVDVLPAHLAEIILDGNQDPGPLIAALEATAPGQVSVENWTGPSEDWSSNDLWYSVKQAIKRNPVREGVSLRVVVVDPGIVEVIKKDLEEMVNAIRPSWDFQHWGRDPWIAWLMGAVLWNTLKQLRQQCEQDDIKTVFITTDLRTDKGMGCFHKSHYYKDTRLRSWIGDAGRYHAHQRYRVEKNDSNEPVRIVVIKDEAEGLVGRLVFERFGRHRSQGGPGPSLAMEVLA
jgi:hypothetical protein